MDKPGVLLIGNFLSAVTGSRGASENLAAQLAEAGYAIITTSKQRSRPRRLVDILSTIIRRRDEYAVAGLEVYSGLAFWWAEAAAVLLRRLGKPYIATLHGGNLAETARRHPQAFRRFLARADVVTTPSNFLRQAFQPMRPDLHYLPNGLDLSRYPYDVRQRSEGKICWLRAFHEIYNPLMAVEAMALLVKRFPQAHLEMIGPDKADGTHQQAGEKIAEYGLQEKIAMIGPIQNRDVPARLQNYDLFINTTRLESFGVAVMEAAAAGLPLVTTAVGELPLLWSHGENALLVPDGDAPAMAEALAQIISQPALAHKLSANARARAEQFDWGAILPTWEHLFLTLAKGR